MLVIKWALPFILYGCYGSVCLCVVGNYVDVIIEAFITDDGEVLVYQFNTRLMYVNNALFGFSLTMGKKSY